MVRSHTIETVPAESMTERKREALRNLIDDPCPKVRSALVSEFGRLGAEGIDLLQSICDGGNRLLAGHARRVLDELRHANPTDEFRSFIRSLNYELESGMILLCRVAYPQLRPEEIFNQVNAIANRCRELLVRPATPRERCIVINRVLFHELGFRGNSEDYENPDNSFLNRVFETRKGLPISLSILYILVGQRIGAELDPIAYPGHFMVGCFEDDLPFYIDPYSRGKFITPEQLLHPANSIPTLSQLSNFAPAPVREVLCRCCRNLAKHYALQRQPSMSRLFASFVDDFEKTYQKQTS